MDKIKFGTISKWLATSFIAISALQVSLFVEWSLAWWSFVGFLIGHIIWSIAAFKMREWPLLALNAFFIFVDTYAILVRL